MVAQGPNLSLQTSVDQNSGAPPSPLELPLRLSPGVSEFQEKIQVNNASLMLREYSDGLLAMFTRLRRLFQASEISLYLPSMVKNILLYEKFDFNFCRSFNDPSSLDKSEQEPLMPSWEETRSLIAKVKEDPLGKCFHGDEDVNVIPKMIHGMKALIAPVYYDREIALIIMSRPSSSDDFNHKDLEMLHPILQQIGRALPKISAQLQIQANPNRQAATVFAGSLIETKQG